MPTADFRLQRLDHVSLNVSDRAQAIAWYRETLGLDLRNQPSRDDWPAFMGAFGACIALFQARSGTVEPRVPESIGLRHVAFMVTKADLDAAQAHLATQGVPFRFEDHGNTHSVYLADPDGNVIELTTYDP